MSTPDRFDSLPNLRRWSLFFAVYTILPVLLLAGTFGCGSSGDAPKTAADTGLVPEDEPATTGGGTASHQSGGATGDDDLDRGAKDAGLTVIGRSGERTTIDNDNEPGDPLPGRDPFLEGVPDSTGAAATAPSPFDLPEGASPAELLEFIRELDQRPSQARSERQAIEELIALLNARLEAAEAVIDHPERTADQRVQAVEAKLLSLRMLARIEEGAFAKYEAYVESLKGDKNAEIARLSELEIFQLSLLPLATGESDNTEPVLTKLKELLAKEDAGQAIFYTTQEAADLLQRAGHWKDAAIAMRAIAERFKDDKDEQGQPSVIAQEAASLMVNSKFVRMQAEFFEFVAGREEAYPVLLELIQNELAEEPLGSNEFQLAMKMGQMLEFTGHTDKAEQIYGEISAAFEGHENADLAALVAQAMSTARTRLSLVGKPLEITGQLARGGPFDFEPYQGKVVLVDFWATWCGPCLAEVPNIKATYEKYHSDGFDVIGINLDEDPDALDRYIAATNPPWAIVVSSDPENRGFDSPMAMKCGVEAIPFMLLLGRDGKVKYVHVRGDQLATRVQELLGEKDADEDAGDASTDDVGSAGSEPADAPANGDGARASGTFAARFVGANEEEPAVEENGASPDAAGSQRDELADVNPYAPRDGLTTLQLVEFLLKMQTKHELIQKRPGFSDAICLAADRVLAGDASERQKELAALAKMRYLHRDACFGDTSADERLEAFIEQADALPGDAVKKEVAFLRLEQKALAGKQLDDPKEIILLLNELQSYMEAEALSGKHLRLASATVGTINQLQDSDQRETHFQKFGKLFAASEDKQLARYGNKIAGK